MINIGKYKRLTVDKNEFIRSSSFSKSIKTYVPSPTETDYKIGYITRYFAQKGNDPSSYVFEINKDEYSNLVSNPFYVNVKLNWRLTGTVEQVRESNSKSVTLASHTIKSITLYLPNTLQFYKR
jgi:hypothetical protein